MLVALFYKTDLTTKGGCVFGRGDITVNILDIVYKLL